MRACILLSFLLAVLGFVLLFVLPAFGVFVIFRPVADLSSCSAAACEELANEADAAYISDNELTLYCDEKCLDTPSDPFGGLWCNMRGLGQPCRACRADK